MLAKTMRRALLASALIAGTVIASASTVAAAPANGPSALRLSLDTGGASVRSFAVLECHPAGGTHKHAAQACTELETVQADFRQMTPDQSKACTLQYQPITAKLEGNWHGKPVSFTETYPNSCVLKSETGAVFDL
ncbi:SSI family serine proteinase inhibitor [Saccharopolyspora pogona]|uniref:SSI family serine proteinase inhibitor n=1 Tax=Saccharopolyspora pogona TaxID=333966 RepID=UPI0016842C46|nr:SSI family serine proteinase inhibitor [Saccharopolyspora pogona]